MNYPRILHAVFNMPWAVHRPFLGSVFQLLHSRLFAGEQAEAALSPGQFGSVPGLTDPLRITGDLQAGRGRSGGRFGAWRLGKQAMPGGGFRLVNHTARIQADAARRCGGDAGRYYAIVDEEEAALPAGQILHIFGSGTLGKHLSSFDELCSGGLSVDRIHAAIAEGKDDPKVSAILLQLDTPGGICHGMPEAAALVRAACEVKTVAAFCDSLTASAGYWITSAADNFYITPSADVGSVGVYAAIVDYTEWCKKQGIAVTLVKDGAHKGAGFPGTTMTEEQVALIQESVMTCSASFKKDVRQRRGDVSDSTLQGQCFTGPAAIDARLADTLVNDLSAALSDLANLV
ncbi:ClpP class periplasmic serine protease [Opitutaceae bacterium TAV1]|nr:ClpP class periplasmic serine protease [Opitutaceae bacterium TAV1]